MRQKTAIIFFTLWALSPTLAQELTGDQIIERVDEIMNPQQMQAEMTMIIETSSGELREFVYQSYSKNHGEKNLMRYLKPSKLRGNGTLMLNYSDDIWAYFHKTKRVRKLAEHAKRQKMEGSDFSYEDMGSGNAFVMDYAAERLEDEKVEGIDCYVVELTRKENSDAGYSRLIMWVDKSNFVPLMLDYYDLKDAELKLKYLTMSDVEVIQGIPTPKRMVMTNTLDNSQTMMEINSVNYEVDLDDNLFTERGLRE
ncbi:outer membrane lipoprotein-sorting protein [candidate division LCP-89 bacterium B3_LCP]|uniref:Outer membrane lipoprotein-sorting protein n=1 Tax=candidate division LCP-89 bacterium B3_LCP TaxID=2012998 RepID=A0A532USM1_UNCL8|nr:MAG: outer membrane lipoprotein-sorting protein [candidate division LCP-89 bacterium B3_LCP]